MIHLQIKFRCPLCNNAQAFYIMPLKEKVGKNDFVNSLNKYSLQCKKCGKNFVFEFKIKAV